MFDGWFGTREHVVRHRRTTEGGLSTHLECDIESLPAHNGGVNRGEERSHRIVFRHEQKVDGAIESSDVAINANAEPENYFTLGRLVHGAIISEGTDRSCHIQRSRLDASAALCQTSQ